MQTIRQNIQVSFRYDVHFTRDLLAPANPLLADTIRASDGSGPARTVFVLDSGLCDAAPELAAAIGAYCRAHSHAIEMSRPPLVVPGGEAAKNDPRHVTAVQRLIHDGAICRHSYVVAIGGGAVLDMAGYAAASAHRGVRLIRVPTTVLAQNDSAVGVKNSVNAFQKKNFLGAFAPPYAVLNDSRFLETLSARDWRSGISEAIKVALIKDASFFDAIETDADALNRRNAAAMERLIYRCAQLHLDHIASGGDPFETGSSRPLDFGHWAAHKLEQLTGNSLRHGEAVAIGIALDSTYALLAGMLPEADWNRILCLLRSLAFQLAVPELESGLESPANQPGLLHGLTEFQEHIGGRLTIMMLTRIGSGVEVHRIDHAVMRQAISCLAQIGASGPGALPARRITTQQEVPTADGRAGATEWNLGPTPAR